MDMSTDVGFLWGEALVEDINVGFRGTYRGTCSFAKWRTKFVHGQSHGQKPDP